MNGLRRFCFTLAGDHLWKSRQAERRTHALNDIRMMLWHARNSCNLSLEVVRRKTRFDFSAFCLVSLLFVSSKFKVRYIELFCAENSLCLYG